MIYEHQQKLLDGLAKQVEKANEYEDLLGEVLGTLSISANQNSKISELKELVSKWQKRWEQMR